MSGHTWKTRMKLSFGKSWQLEANAQALARNLKQDRGGLSQAEFEERRARTILTGMERATIANQTVQNTERGEDRPLTHAVSGHGPDTDQVGRVLHGHRADEMATDAAGGTAPAKTVPVEIAGTQTSTPEYTAVGSDPSNVSGAFDTGRAMLNTVKEGFAQADMVSRFAESERASGRDNAADQSRFATKVSGVGETMGYNLEATGPTAQTKGTTLSKDEIAERAKTVQRTDDLTTAQIVMDPAFQKSPTYDKMGNLILGADGKPVMALKRTGWNMQTAYATKGDGDTGFAKPQDVGGSDADLRSKFVVAKKELAAAITAAEPAEADLRKLRGDVEAKNRVLQETVQRVGDARNDDERDAAKVVALIETVRSDIAKDKADLEAFDSGPGFDMFADPEDAPAQPTAQTVAQPATGRSEEEINADLATHQAEETRLKGLQTLIQVRDEIKSLKAKEDEAAQAAGLATARVKSAQDRLAAAKRDALAGGDEDEAEDDGDAEGGQGGGKAGYDPGTGVYTNKRPPKPANLKGVDETGDSLTAHHLRPWNQIRTLLNDGLADPSGAKLKALFADSNVADDKIAPGFWTELALPKEQRGYAFAETINKVAAELCWAPQNIFMGPLGEKRGDDPGENVDLAYTRSGIPTARSAMVEMTDPDRMFARTLAASEVAAQADATTLTTKPQRDERVTLMLTALAGRINAEVLRQNPDLKPAALTKAESELSAHVGRELGRALLVAATGREVDDGTGLDDGDAERMAMTAVAEALEKLKSTPEGIGTLSDVSARSGMAYDIVRALKAKIQEALKSKQPELADPARQEDFSEATRLFSDRVHAAVVPALERAAKGEAMASPSGLRDLLTERVHDAEAEVRDPRAYDPAEWETRPDGKKVRRRKLASKYAETGQ